MQLFEYKMNKIIQRNEWKKEEEEMNAHTHKHSNNWENDKFWCVNMNVCNFFIAERSTNERSSKSTAEKKLDVWVKGKNELLNCIKKIYHYVPCLQ